MGGHDAEFIRAATSKVADELKAAGLVRGVSANTPSPRYPGARWDQETHGRGIKPEIDQGIKLVAGERPVSRGDSAKVATPGKCYTYRGGRYTTCDPQ
jgi:hypothetical protein